MMTAPRQLFANLQGVRTLTPAGVKLAAIAFGLLLSVAILAPVWDGTQNNQAASLDLMNGFTPPLTTNASTGDWFLLGSDDQGRDLVYAIMSGLRISMIVGFLSVLLALAIGVPLGLIAGYVGGVTDTIIMRIAEVQLTFPPIFTAMLFYGITKGVASLENQEFHAIQVLVLAIGLSGWVQFARVIRAAVLVEKEKQYVDAARVIGLKPKTILWRHILPNVMGPVVVIATVSLAVAILSEATLSYLGVGVPPTQPSLGTLIRIGQDFLFSGEWWILFFPALTLLVLSLCINVLGDWFADFER